MVTINIASYEHMTQIQFCTWPADTWIAIKTVKMSKKILLLLSIFLTIVLYSNADDPCADKWCHPYMGYYCCPYYSCSNYWFQGICSKMPGLGAHRDQWRWCNDRQLVN